MATSTQVQPVDALIRTSDRSYFRRCRRLWNWTSSLREGREPREKAIYFWVGTGVHYALQDFHTVKIYKTAEMAFRAYVEACRRTPGYKMPDGWEDEAKVGISMMQYYPLWLENRDPLKTFQFIHPATKQKTWAAELDFKIPFPEEIQQIARANGYRAAYYIGTFDRIIEDENKDLWIVEYKAYKKFSDLNFLTDAQVASYIWAANYVFKQFGRNFKGMIHQQHLKGYAAWPLELQDGTFSVNKGQGVSHRMYRKALIEKYGEVAKAPAKNVAFLNYLASQEGEDSDPSIRRDRVLRNAMQVQSTAKHIMAEAAEMLNRNTALYPSPTRDCNWDCPFQSACISMDDGSDYELELETVSQPAQERDKWRKHLPQAKELEQICLSQSNLSSGQPGT